MANYMQEYEQELYMAQNPKKNKNTSLATNASSSYNKIKETSGSYTGNKTGFTTSSNYVPGQISKDTTPTVKTQTPKVETQNTPKTSGIGETYRAKTESINKSLPKLEDVKLTSPMYQKNDTLKSLSVPTKLERDFAKGIFGDKRESEIYNSGVLEEAAKAGFLKDTRTQDDLFRTGFHDLPDIPKYAFTEKADDKVKYDLFSLLDFGETHNSESKNTVTDFSKPLTTKQNALEEIGKSRTKPASPDATEFGEDSETYKILQDLSRRWYETSDNTERDRLHGVAEDIRRLARGKNRVKYGTDEIFDVMHKNAKLGQLVKAGSHITVPAKMSLTNPIFAGLSGELLEPAAFLTAMSIDKNQWNYKYNDYWRVGGDEDAKRGGKLKYFDGKDLDVDNNRNWLPWIYFDGYLIGADKFGNMNMAYVGKKMGLPEWVYKNFTTMDDPEDIFWIDKGTDYAKSGR